MEWLFKTQQSNVFNCGYGHGYSVKEIIDSVKEVTEVDFRVDKADRRDGDPAVLVAKNEKIRNIIGWTPLYDNLNTIISTAYNWEKSSHLKEWREQKNE